MSTSSNLLWKAISMGIQVVVALLLTRIIVNEFGSDSNGFYELSNDFVNYASVVSIALNSMASRNIIMHYYNDNSQNLNSYFNSILYGDYVLSLSLFLFFSVIVYFLQIIINIPSYIYNDVKILFFLVFCNFSITVAFSVYGVSTLVKNRIDLDSKRNIESNIIKLVVFIVLINLFSPRVWFLGISLIVSSIYVIIRNSFYMRQLLPNVKIHNRSFFCKEIILELLSSGCWNSLTKISSIFLTGLDLLLANHFVSVSAMGVLSIAKIIPKYLFAALTNLSTVFVPKILINYAKNDNKKLVSDISYAIRIMSIFSTTLEVVFVVYSKDFFSFWVPNQDCNELFVLALISIAGYILLMPIDVLWSVFTATNKVRLSSSYLVAESIIVILVLLLLLSFDFSDSLKLLLIVGVSSIFEVIRALFFLPFVSAKLLNIRYSSFYSPLLRNIFSFLLSTILCNFFYFWLNPISFLGLLVSLLITIIICLMLCLFILLDKNERIMIYKRMHLK